MHYQSAIVGTTAAVCTACHCYLDDSGFLQLSTVSSTSTPNTAALVAVLRRLKISATINPQAPPPPPPTLLLWLPFTPLPPPQHINAYTHETSNSRTTVAKTTDNAMAAT
eukprot:TRINITY_DN27638_c0_g2_i1.p1 TRINITY_DN27638_c0_g2~~TRINITY_DN27638_c0_g2_i1.p1  ORF type:complete len:110 (+),score=10.01 TRINITY_DN27638_c0_g2_i1:129-458(+)